MGEKSREIDLSIHFDEQVQKVEQTILFENFIFQIAELKVPPFGSL